LRKDCEGETRCAVKRETKPGQNKKATKKGNRLKNPDPIRIVIAGEKDGMQKRERVQRGGRETGFVQNKIAPMTSKQEGIRK